MAYCPHMRKWTLRVEDDIAEEYAHFCRVTGISIQAGLEAAVRSTVQRFIDNERQPPELWAPFEQSSLHRWLGNVEMARDLDAARRSKRRAASD